MIAFIPYKVDVEMKSRPYGNYLILTALLYVFLDTALFGINKVNAMILDGWNPIGLLGHMWLHGGLLHFAGNAIILWVFGNAVCSRVGDVLYIFLYIAGGVLSAAAQNLFLGGKVIGASGAISFIVGIYVILFTFNTVTCRWFILVFPCQKVNVSGYWIIAVWFMLNLMSALIGYQYVSNVAYLAHVGGFVSGIIFGIILTKTKIAKRDNDAEVILKQIRSDNVW
jgi:membrane associated rhomboid family serine protease